MTKTLYAFKEALKNLTDQDIIDVADLSIFGDYPISCRGLEEAIDDFNYAGDFDTSTVSAEYNSLIMLKTVNMNLEFINSGCVKCIVSKGAKKWIIKVKLLNTVSSGEMRMVISLILSTSVLWKGHWWLYNP